MLHPRFFTRTTALPSESFLQAQVQDERLGLSLVEPLLAKLSRQAAVPSALGEHLRTQYVTRVQQHVQRLRTKPFLSPPGAISSGTFTLGRVDQQFFRLTNEELLRHLIIVGPSGSGKTTIIHRVLRQLRAQGVHIILPDYKGDYRALAANDDDFLIIHADVPLNILEHDPNFSRETYIDVIVRHLAASYYGGEHLKQVGQETLTLAYTRHNMPSVQDWLRVAQTLSTPKDTYQRRDALNGLIMRLQRLIALFPNMTRTRRGIPHRTLATHSLYFGAPDHNETYDFLSALIVTLCYHDALAQQRRDHLDRFLGLDEGLLTFGDKSRIDGPVLLPLIPRLREFGTAVGITTAHLGAIHETLRANMYTTIALRLTNATDASLTSRTLGLNSAQAEHLLHVPMGTAIVRTGKWDLPFLMTFDPPTTDKTVDHNTWQAAIERTNALAPQQVEPIVITTPIQSMTATEEEPRVAPIPNPPAPSRAPVVLTATRTPRPPQLLLSKPETALLDAIQQLVITTSTVAYQKPGLSLQAGDTAAKRLETLGLITRTPIVARDGRGGKAIALQLTKEGYERLGITQRKGLRGGSSAQHTYLVHSLSKLIPGAHVEHQLGGTGGKSVDLLVKLGPENESLLAPIAHNAEYFTSNCVTPAAGSLVAIEVETTPDTVINNIEKNLDAGLALTIAAVMPKAIDTARKLILRDVNTTDQARVCLTNVFTLIAALSEES